MATQTESELKMAQLIAEAINLEDMEPEEIDPEEQLFGDGLGLDSIDALEISLAISQEYGVQMKAEDQTTREAFATLRSLTAYVESNK
ncbi:phosphopantetheine-binding protein [Alteromonas ponticola]|uniref:Phosphopantetheine-binding protein n=1 Tax=Alteromonas aquimaris TaxID=2998417 RepID=A0ABT3P814_9ALTE|nr:phosphopantetheine-binding protein [Alteromonas aquimaris]MCW8108903.1 phosphopantetheine-binding protein [Alteromonas aquimaris]